MERLKVEATKKNEDGNLVEFKLTDGRVVNHKECAELIDKGELNLIHTVGKSGADVIRSYPNGDESDNLSELPTFE